MENMLFLLNINIEGEKIKINNKFFDEDIQKMIGGKTNVVLNDLEKLLGNLYEVHNRDNVRNNWINNFIELIFSKNKIFYIGFYNNSRN